MLAQDFEKLGVFYLGREYDADNRTPGDALVLYDAKDLVTHAVIVGMTGSGKTGLGIALLEEAAIDGIPALVIDPKGDLANLLLTFPDLRADDFAPWVNAEDARRKGQTPQEYAAAQAETWRKGLAEWGQDGARIARLREAVEIGLYTPGSTAATPVSIVQSFAAPSEEEQADSEMLRERVSNAATSLLSLIGAGDDPLQSREHILLSSILAHCWKEGKDLDLPSLIHALQTPPFARVGVIDLESFFPAKERFALAMKLNNMLASPGFEAWLEGPPLDIGSLLHTEHGKPRLAILSIAHLGDKERMFFVSLLLNQVLGWMRAQPGTTSLRALLYMDEIFGYFPPVANPPSKQPLLTLLKQARAYGLGIVLATQNPVDLDYKGLSNTGTWFLGRLQTERDKNRVLEGLEGAAATTGSDFDRATMDRLLSGLGNRVFLMNNVHDDGPCLFQVRWVLSYLRGPLTRAQLRTLAEATEGKVPAREAGAPKKLEAGAASRPVLPPEVKQYFLPPFTPPPPGCALVYLPRVLGMGSVYFQDARKGVDHETAVALLAECTDSPTGVGWGEAVGASLAESDLASDPQDGASFGEVPPQAAKARSYDAWKKSLTDFLYRDYQLELLESVELGEVSRPGESERDFRARLAQAAREERDLQVEKLRQKFAPRMATLQERIRKAQVAVEKEKAQASQSKVQTSLSFGATVLGALLGRKKISVTNVNKATTTARGVGRSMKEAQDVQYAEQNVAALKAQLGELEQQFQEETQKIHAALDPATAKLTPRTLKPKKTNIRVGLTALGWAPFWKSQEGFLSPAWRK